LANIAFARSVWPWAATAAAFFEKLPFRFQLAYVIENGIDQPGYTDSRDRLRERLAYAELELSEARDEQLDVEGVLTFAEYILMNAGSLWVNATSGDKRTLQRALFPEALAWGASGFGTAVTCRAFSQIRVIPVVENGVASPRGPGRFYTLRGAARRSAA
jgi:hypothetical protein